MWNFIVVRITRAIGALLFALFTSAVPQIGLGAAPDSFGLAAGITYRGAPIARLTYAWPQFSRGDIEDGWFETSITYLGGVDDGPGRVADNTLAISHQFVDGFGRFRVRLGATYLQRTSFRNGSHLNFNLGVGWAITDRLELRLEHISNAGLKMPNRGIDFALVSWRF